MIVMMLKAMAIMSVLMTVGAYFLPMKTILLIMTPVMVGMATMMVCGPRCRESNERWMRGEYDDAPFFFRFTQWFHRLLCYSCNKFHNQIGLLGKGVRRHSKKKITPVDMDEIKKRIKDRIAGGGSS